MRLMKLATLLAMFCLDIGYSKVKAEDSRCCDYTDNNLTGTTHAYRTSHNNKYVKCDYRLILDCATKLPLISWTTVGKDRGSLDTSSRNYKIDVNLGYSCQQHSSDTYSSVVTGFDVGSD